MIGIADMRLYLAVLVLAVTCSLSAARVTPGATLYVAVNGRDGWSGRRAAPDQSATDGPFATLERARDEIRRMKQAGGLPAGGVTVEIGGGVYERQAPFELTEDDSGTAAAPIVYRAQAGAAVRLVGGKFVPAFTPVSDRAIRDRLDPAARGHVLQADLRALGVTDFGSPAGRGLEVFFQDRPMTLARWPNQGFTKIVEVVGGDPYNIRGTVGDRVGKFTYEGDRPQRWAGENDIWMDGYWFWDWSEQRQKVAAIDTAQRIISLAPPYHHYGYRKGQWYYAFNILAELDTPGEWYLDRESGILYFWPPAALTPGAVVVSISPLMVSLRDASYITLRGLTFELARGTGAVVTGGTRVRVSGCTFRNLGGQAVALTKCTDSGVSDCEMYDLGGGGITLDGGDRPTLTRGDLYAENNHIHDFGRWQRMYTPGISLQGVGGRATHNLIHDAPHSAILFGGNDHLIAFNEIHDVCTESNDAGAIYGGRDWTQRGTVIRDNYLHDVTGFEHRFAVGVYLDDQLSGITIESNLFYHVFQAAFIGGGRDNIIRNNIFVDCDPAVHIDARGLNWAANDLNDTLVQRLRAMPYERPPWSERYPKLLTLLADDPMAPKGNRVVANVCAGKWEDPGGIEEAARPLTLIARNLIGQDPRFVDAAKLNFQLRDDSPAYRMGFQRIAIERIGLRGAARR